MFYILVVSDLLYRGGWSPVVEAIMKLWPPPAGPKDRDPERDASPRGSIHAIPKSPSSSSYEGNQPLGRPADQPRPAAGLCLSPPPGYTFSKPLSPTAILHTGIRFLEIL